MEKIQQIFFLLFITFLIQVHCDDSKHDDHDDHYFDENILNNPEFSIRVPRTLVLNFDHDKDRTQDLPIKGQQWAPRYYHIQTPLNRNDNIMFRFDLEGYSYGQAQPLDIMWCGYSYYGEPEVFRGKIIDRNRNYFNIQTLDHYYRGDGKLVLLFGPIKRFCNGFSLYYQGHILSNFTKGLKKQQYKVIVTNDKNRLN